MSSWPCLLQSLPVDGLKFFFGRGETPKHFLKLTASEAPENWPFQKERDPSSNHPFSGANSLSVSGRI